MVIARQTLTLKEYLALDTDPNIRYEVVDGELMEMPPESDRNNLISLYLLAEFLKLVPLRLIRHKDTELVVTGNRARIRLPGGSGSTGRGIALVVATIVTRIRSGNMVYKDGIELRDPQLFWEKRSWWMVAGPLCND